MANVGLIDVDSHNFPTVYPLGIITWNWMWVLSPIWIDAILVVLLLAVLIILDRR